jgi:MFS family permease
MNFKQDGIAPNSGRLLWAGFMAILAAGVGFGVRGGILANWGADFGFTGKELGDIMGAMFSSFCFGIIIGGLVCDRIGYGKLVIAAFLFHALSAFVTFGTSADYSQETNYELLYWGTFLFGLANGTLEAVANPLVATLFPKRRTHYLNILHASWPGGLVLGGLIGWTLADTLSWKMQLALFLVPTLIYGLMFLGQHMPKSEASRSGLTLGEMLKDVGVLGGVVICFLLTLFFGPLISSPGASYAIAGMLLLFLVVLTHTHGNRGEAKVPIGSGLLFLLFVIHAMVGAVELGTDGWIQNITGNILTPAEGKILFIFTSVIMFSLRFCAGFIESKLGLSPIGILLVCAVLACVGLNLASGIETFVGAMLALAVYAVGKTFFWPTMLAVTGDRFPKTGAIAMSIMGGIGMMSAGLIGAPGLGYAKDRFASEALERDQPAIYTTHKASTPSQFLVFKDVTGIDGTKLGAITEKVKKAREDLVKAGTDDPKAALDKLTTEERAVHDASIEGDRRTLTWDSIIPGLMAVLYLLLMLYFKTIGGYKIVQLAPIEEEKETDET